MTGPTAGAEIVADALRLAGASAVSEEEVADGLVRLTADVTAPPVLPTGWWVEELEVDVRSGLDAWRAHARPVRAGRRIVLQPPWIPPAASSPGDVTVVLDPGRAFGSGSHPSTRLALAVIEQAVRGGERVLDVGCGSGVLAVTALLLGASSACAVDPDPEAVAATASVAHANGVADRIEVSDTPVGAVAGDFDLVVANISARTLVELAPALRARLRSEARLVLAGFLDGQADAVRGAHAELRELARPAEDGWAALLLAR